MEVGVAGAQFMANVLLKFSREQEDELLDQLKKMPPGTVQRIERNPGWQPIETAPRNEEVLLWGLYMTRPAAGILCEGDRYWTACVDGRLAIEHQSDFGTSYMSIDYPTHWMPLPAPPCDSDTHPKDGDAKQGSAL